MGGSEPGHEWTCRCHERASLTSLTNRRLETSARRRCQPPRRTGLPPPARSARRSFLTDWTTHAVCAPRASTAPGGGGPGAGGAGSSLIRGRRAFPNRDPRLGRVFKVAENFSISARACSIFADEGSTTRADRRTMGEDRGAFTSGTRPKGQTRNVKSANGERDHVDSADGRTMAGPARALPPVEERLHAVFSLEQARHLGTGAEGIG